MKYGATCFFLEDIGNLCFNYGECNHTFKKTNFKSQANFSAKSVSLVILKAIVKYLILNKLN